MNTTTKIKKPKKVISVRISQDLLRDIDKIEGLTRTEAIENGLKLVLAYETMYLYEKRLK